MSEQDAQDPTQSDPTQSDSMQTIFASVCELPTDQREAALSKACGNDSRLRNQVETLLRAHDNAGDFMAEPTTDLPDPNASEISAKVGDEIDRYKLLERIGEGGFGVVYMAQQTAPVRRRVALKIIKLGMDTRQVVARFEAERQALAMMDHPNIARVFDGGATDTGRPYFVMELVRGDPITNYCDRAKLTTPERLELFQQVCAAIQHAHQKGIIHRDIKPSNVLVTVADGRPLVKVIDFGIAKATNQELTEKTLFTEFRQLIGTPQYMSPEQAERSGVDIDTRSDIYSLGVLLYEMLTGCTPIDPLKLRSAQWGELQRLILDEEPTKPSAAVTGLGADGGEIAKRRSTEVRSLGGSLKGDLDWIVMRSLEKDRTRRYGTASQLADDIGRYLTDQPVEASPPSMAYRFSKFTKRNKKTLTAAALSLTLLLAGLIGTSIAAFWAIKEREKAVSASEIATANEELAAKNATKANASAQRANRIATMLGSPYGLLPAAEIDRLSMAWQKDIEELRTQRGDNDIEVVRSECQYATWLSYQGRKDAINAMREIHTKAKDVLGVSDPSFLSLSNAHTAAQAARGGDEARLLPPLYSDTVESLEKIHGEKSAIALLPEYAVALHVASDDAAAAKIVERYLDAIETDQSAIPSIEFQKLDYAVGQLATWGYKHPKLHSQLREVRDRQTNAPKKASTANKDLASDLEKLQGKWETRMSDDPDSGFMQQSYQGNAMVLRILDKDHKRIQDMESTIELRHVGPFRVIEVRVPLNPTPVQTVAYRFDSGELKTASGFANDNNKAATMNVWKRMAE